MTHIYLDNNATTALHPEVAEAMAQCQGAANGNPSSPHLPGRQARRLVEDARDGICELLGGVVASREADQLVFTSGGTESNNLAVRGLAGRNGHLVLSAIEHPSIAATVDFLEAEGFEVTRLAVDPDGMAVVEALPGLLRADTRLVSVMLGNHETGVLQPVSRLADICREHSIPFHCDAVQCVAKIEVNFRDLGASAMSVSAHKFHGPKGIGALLIRHGTALEPLLHGGFQQLGQRPGTEPVELIVGMFAALRIWRREARDRQQRLEALRTRFEDQLVAGCPHAVIHGRRAPRLPHTTNVSFPGLDRQALVMALDLAEVACATGSACASGSSEPSPVLLAMGVSPPLVGSAIRFSLSALTTTAEVDLAVRRILSTHRDLQQRIEGRKQPSPSRNRGS